MKIQFDKDGYPAEESLEYIRRFPLTPDREKIDELLRDIVEAWMFSDRAQEKNGLWVFSTGGWSGNESLIYALQQSSLWAILHWRSVEFSGGFLAIATTEQKKKQLAAKIAEFVSWAWKLDTKPAKS